MASHAVVDLRVAKKVESKSIGGWIREGAILHWS